ncbi:ER membrane protein SH3-domain-containing protein [Aspergillus avenaceus]|uniref:ER membrane protein SH3-domain-containing protein n=1 Tax=Aspergillus avenaceus TaxID=36643 RepID=A0A5N6TH12_ASPAV|nr:ER membrane protein SH3-domain-containing protein [Aspergillus avenaceus]
MSQAEGLTMEVPPGSISKSRAFAIIACITCITGVGNLLSGLLTVCIPVIATDLHIPPELELWPTSAFALACGCTLLPCGAAADVLGCCRACLVGALFQTASAVGSGLSATSTQLIALRVTAGLAASCCLPGAVGVAAHTFPSNHSPRLRSIAFASMGGGHAVGFGLGLVLGGVFSDTIGWRWGFYATAVLNGAVLLLALWALPPIDSPLNNNTLTRLAQDVDWIGALIISASLALLSYELAVATGSNSLCFPLNIALLVVAITLLPVFAFWMHRQTRNSRPALIPNALWTNIPFTSICMTVCLVWGSLNASEQLTALYLQDIRDLSPLTSSLYFLPAPICGALVNLATGLCLPYLRPSLAVPAGCLISGLAPLLLATLCKTTGPSYWAGVFQAMALNPLGADLMYTIANLVMTASFPNHMQALAGGVFNMLAQIGKSVGIATSAVIARRVSIDLETKEGVLQGYRAGWWYDFALGSTSFFLGIIFSLLPYDYPILWSTTPTPSAHYDHFETHLRFLHASPPLIPRILHIVISLGLIGLISKLYKPSESNMLFDGASLVLYMCGITVYIANIVKGLRLVSGGKYGAELAGPGEENGQILGREDSLKVLAASNTILALVLVGVLVLQAGQWYAERKDAEESQSLGSEPAKKSAAAKKKN